VYYLVLLLLIVVMLDLKVRLIVKKR